MNIPYWLKRHIKALLYIPINNAIFYPYVPLLSYIITKHKDKKKEKPGFILAQWSQLSILD